MAKIRRSGVTYHINVAEKATGPEWQVRHGSKIIARYGNEAEADEHLRRIFTGSH